MVVYNKAKRAKKRNLNKEKISVCVILLIIVAAVIYLIVSNRLLDLRKKDKVADTTTETQAPPQEPEVVEKNETEEVDVPDIPDNMGGYKVVGKLVIDKIEVEKNILAICNDSSLKVSTAKLYGPNLNEPGNFCICGHNWKNMKKRMTEMQVGDTFYTVDKETRTKVNYEIDDIYTCVPEDLSCLEQNDDGLKVITIITCSPGGATRLICKTHEI